MKLLPLCDHLYRYEAYHNGEWIEKPEEGWTLWYGDLREDSRGEWVMPSLLSGGDYANSGTCELSNHRVFLEKHGKKPGVHDVEGGHGTFAVAVRKDLLESDEDIKDDLAGLEDYPLLDEEDHSLLEMNESIKAWDDWACSDVRGALVKCLDGLVENPEAAVEGLEDLLPMFTAASEDVGQYWTYEGGGMWMDIDKVMPFLLDMVLVEVTPDEMLPTLVGREWKSTHAKKEFQERLKG